MDDKATVRATWLDSPVWLYQVGVRCCGSHDWHGGRREDISAWLTRRHKIDTTLQEHRHCPQHSRLRLIWQQTSLCGPFSLQTIWTHRIEIMSAIRQLYLEFDLLNTRRYSLKLDDTEFSLDFHLSDTSFIRKFGKWILVSNILELENRQVLEKYS